MLSPTAVMLPQHCQHPLHIPIFTLRHSATLSHKHCAKLPAWMLARSCQKRIATPVTVYSSHSDTMKVKTAKTVGGTTPASMHSAQRHPLTAQAHTPVVLYKEQAPTAATTYNTHELLTHSTQRLSCTMIHTCCSHTAPGDCLMCLVGDVDHPNDTRSGSVPTLKPP